MNNLNNSSAPPYSNNNLNNSSAPPYSNSPIEKMSEEIPVAVEVEVDVGSRDSLVIRNNVV